MITEDILRVLFRDVPATKAIERWENRGAGKNPEPLCVDFDRELAQTALMNRVHHYSVDDAEYAFNHIQQINLEPHMGGLKDFGVFGLLAHGDTFLDGNMKRAKEHPEFLFLQAISKGQPIIANTTIDGITYRSIEICGRRYAPNRNEVIE